MSAGEDEPSKVAFQKFLSNGFEDSHYFDYVKYFCPPEEIEKIARTKYRLVKKGEIIMLYPAEKKKESQRAEKKAEKKSKKSGKSL